jgi:hypothetical protein
LGSCLWKVVFGKLSLGSCPCEVVVLRDLADLRCPLRGSIADLIKLLQSDMHPA